MNAVDWFPLVNSLRISLVATAFTLTLGVLAAYWALRLPRGLKGAIDCVLTLPLVLPPTVVGFFLLKLLGPRGTLGAWLLDTFSLRLTMTWQASIFAVVIVTFPLVYRTVRGAFEAFDRDLLDAGRTLGKSEGWMFFRLLLPGCRHGILAGGVLAFARGLGEYGATSMVSGYTPGRTATVATTVYQLWREGNDALAYRWVGVNLCISLAVLVAVNLLERRER